MVLRVNDREFEIYLSSNGAIKIEEELDCSFSDIREHKLSYKSMIVMIYGCLWERNKLTLSQVCTLMDEYLKTQKLSELSRMVNSELIRFAGVLNKSSNEIENDENEEDKKK